jgi:hypothetical protein
MAAVVHDQTLRRRLATAGPETAGRFTWDRTAAQHAEIYRRVATEAHRRAATAPRVDTRA